jgi:hypothetical protein
MAGISATAPSHRDTHSSGDKRRERCALMMENRAVSGAERPGLTVESASLAPIVLQIAVGSPNGDLVYEGGEVVIVLDQTPPPRSRLLGGLCADASCDGILSARGEKILVSRFVSARQHRGQGICVQLGGQAHFPICLRKCSHQSISLPASAAYETQGRFCRNGSTELLRFQSTPEFAAAN